MSSDIIEDIARQMDIEFLKPSSSVVVLRRGREVACVYGNFWPLNPLGNSLLASDKIATHLVLTEHKMQSVEQICIQPENDNFIEKAQDFYYTHNQAVVLKNNFGTKGGSVYFPKDGIDNFHRTLFSLLSRYNNVNISSRENIVNEFRCVCLNDSVELIYLKKRPYILGDGRSSLITLLVSAQYKVIKLKKDLESKLYTIPEEGHRVVLTDQDNLSLGSSPEILEGNEDLMSRLATLARAASSVLGLRFCSVDIIFCDDGTLKVMEVNHGVMFDNFIQHSERNKNEVKRIYSKAIESLFRNS